MFDFDDFDGLDVEDWMIIGGLSEELTDEERKRRKQLEDDLDREDLHRKRLAKSDDIDQDDAR